jgi:LysR family transcriptional regulator, glycine cleavage system transcriptional activator
LRRLPLGSLRVFISVAQELNFTRAADALGVSASAASLQIRALEEYLGQPLFRRNGRVVRLTSEGETLLPRVRAALEQLERAVDDARRGSADGTVRVSTLVSFQHLWLLPRLSRLRQAHPDIDLHLHTSNSLIDFVRDEFHLALRYGHGGYPQLHSEKLLEEWLIPVCTPALFDRHGPLRDPGDLRRYPLIHSSSEPWTTWLFDGHASEEASGIRGAIFDGSSAAVTMAVSGAGLALGRWSLVADEIAAGRLVRASNRAMPLERAYWLVCPQRVRDASAPQRFMQWLRTEAAVFPRPHPPAT